MNWLRFGLASTYALIAFIVFFIWDTGYSALPDVPHEILFIGLILMLGVVFDIAAGLGDKP